MISVGYPSQIQIGDTAFLYRCAYVGTDLNIRIEIEDGIVLFVGADVALRSVKIVGSAREVENWMTGDQSLAWCCRCRLLRFVGDVWDMSFADGICRLSFTTTR